MISFDKKGQQEGASSYRYIMIILLIAAIAVALFLSLRSAINGVFPK
jgi:hypothetical protein